MHFTFRNTKMGKMVSVDGGNLGFTFSLFSDIIFVCILV
jgi:hypothetical protein